MNSHDRELIQRFESCDLTHTEFDHRTHLHIAWIYIKKFELNVCAHKLRIGLQALNKKHAQHITIGYHETITWFWLQTLYRLQNQVCRFSDLSVKYPELFDKEYIFRFYSREILMSEYAKQHRITPDKNPCKQDITDT